MKDIFFLIIFFFSFSTVGYTDAAIEQLNPNDPNYYQELNEILRRLAATSSNPSIGVGTYTPCTVQGNCAVGSPAGPANAVQFNNAGAFGGSSNFVWDGTNVGIGTSGPITTLHVNGSLITQNNVSIGTTLINSPLSIYYPAFSSGSPITQNIGLTCSQLGQYASHQYYNGQSFKISAASLISSVQIGLSGSGGIPTGTLNFQIQTDNVGYPSGSLVNSNATANFIPQVPSGNTNIFNNISFSPGIPIAANTPYWMVVKPNTTQSNGNYFCWNYTNLNPYADGTNADNLDGVWTINATFDNVFIINYTGNPPVWTLGMQYSNANILYLNGNMGIGVTSPGGKLEVEGGNVGIGSSAPGQALDVTGTIRTTNFAMTGQTPVNGYVLTASDSIGDSKWSSAGGVSGWTVSGNNVYETNSGNVGIGTSSPQGALVVTNGNVGIGTWTTAGGNLIVNGGGNVGLGTSLPSGLLEVGNQKFDVLSSGNIGVGSINPGQALDVIGTIRSTGYIANGNVGITTTAPTTCGCKQFTSGLCTTVGTCS